ncbi:hypothetical protein [Lignipirellula cremea]|uniref:Lipoprotein SmpA/OmlA domain-containing protein n=1 Tax=Lignipirellula cremea TaxID=2528010 RepID=A0A518DY71_9BACT|nr:hypothetical protein [Lignipirellula cremea]QDU96799.1 hypothetical protein Pla8534_46200 [Lignipirellula cremea]
MRYLLLLAVLLVAPSNVLAGQPAWPDLAPLLGQPKDSPAVVAMVRQQALSETTKGPSGSFSSPDGSWSMLYESSRIKTIVLRVSPPGEGSSSPERQTFAPPLPGKLTRQDGRAQVVQKLGQPSRPDGDQWLHQGLVIWVFFDQSERQINELYLWQQEQAEKP